MDTVTQAILGGVVGKVAAPRHGRKAVAAGFVAGILPDLDMLAVPFVSEVVAFVTHRSATHSFLVVTVASLLLAPALSRTRIGLGMTAAEWARLLLLCFATHILLDWCTSYGTQMFWPLSRHPYALSIVFIIDPFYSGMLATGLAAAWWARDPRLRKRAAWAALSVSTAYVLAAGALKWQAQGAFSEALAARGFEADAFLVQNTPFNIVLWQGQAVGRDGWAIGFCASPCDPAEIDYRVKPRNPHRDAVESWVGDTNELGMLARFSKGLYRIDEVDGRLVLVDLRFGSGSGPGTARPFAYHVGDLAEEGPRPAEDPLSSVRLGGLGDYLRELVGVLFGDR